MPPVAIFQDIGLPELIIILVLILIFFGANRLPALMRSMGRSVGEFGGDRPLP